MSYYRRLFCNNSCFRLSLILLVVLSYTLPSRVSAQNVYTVEVVGTSDVIINGASDFSGALDNNQIQFGVFNATTTGPQDTRFEGAGALYTSFADDDYIDNAKLTLPYNSGNDVLKPSFSGRNPLGLTGTYFNFGLIAWIFSSNHVYTMKTPEQEHFLADNQKHPVTATEYRLVPDKSTVGSWFRYDNFVSDVTSAIVGSDNFQFLLRFINALNATPSVSNFTYNVPATFGFSSGFTINIPFHDIFYGSGGWASFSTLISFFRSFVSFLYYYAVIVVICRALYRYQ